MNFDARFLLYQDLALVVRCTVSDPLPHHVDRCLIEEWSAKGHAAASDARPTLELPYQVAVVGIAGLDTVEARHLKAWCVDQ